MKKVGVLLIIVIIVLCSLLFIKKEDIEVSQVKSTETEKMMTELTEFEENTSNLFEIKTNSAQNIDLIFEENQVEGNKDLIFYIRTDKSIKGRKVQITENGQKREHKSEVAFINEDQHYCYQYTFLTYKENSISKISITNLPKEDITLYAWVKYNGEKYHIAKAVNSDTREELQKSEDKSLIPTSNLTQEEINTLKQEDIQIMKKKWADGLGININDVDKYIDKYNAKGQGKLHKDGQKIKNAKGEEVMINGVGLFHLLDYGYMFNEETIHALKYWGINCVRLPAYLQYMTSSPVDTVTREERGLNTAFDEYIREMDRIIDIATKEGLYCMVDFHILGKNGNITQYTDMSKRFFTHFAQKYGKQENIFYELANEPHDGSNTDEVLVKYLKQIIPIIQQYDSNPILILGHRSWAAEDLRRFYEYAVKQEKIDNFFITEHYYDGNPYEKYKELYDSTDIPLIYNEWGNSSCNSAVFDKQYTAITKKYLAWWNNENILNAPWMLCHGNYTYSLWNTELGKKSEILQHGVMSEKYLSEYGKLVFGTFLENTLNRIKGIQNLNIEVSVNNENAKEGDNVTLIANVTGGSGTKTYKFIECNKTNGEYKLIQDFSTNNKANWEMGKNKVIYVDVKDDVNKTAIRSKAFKVADNSETEKKILDIIVFTGQSNMVGLANKTYKTNIEENTAFEAKWDGNDNNKAQLVDITTSNSQQNLGDNIYNNGKLILEKQKKSTLIPAFVEKYMKQTGHKVVFIHTAISGKDIAYFTDKSDTNAIEYITKKANKATKLAEEYAKNNNCEIGNKFYIMYQGESDAVSKINVNQYKETYLSFHKKIIKDAKLEYGGIITPGYWHAKNSHYTDDALDVIVEAQQQLANENEDIILTTKNVTKIYSKDSKYMCSDMLHLNEIGLQKIGTDSAEGLLNGGIKLESIEIKQKPQKLKYNKNDNLDLKDGKINLKYSDNTVQEKDMTDEIFNISGYNSDNVGKQEVKLNYANKEAKFEIEVIEKQETEKDDPNNENITGKDENDKDKPNGGKEETNEGNDLEKEEGKDDTNKDTTEDKRSDLTKLEKDDKKTMDVSDKELPKAGKIQLGVVIIFIIGFSVFVYYKLKGMRDIK